MTFEEFMLELGKEFPTPLLAVVVLIGLSMFLLRMKTKKTEFKDDDGKKIQQQLSELLVKYGNNDFVSFTGFTPWITIGKQYVVRVEPQGYAFLTEYLFRPRFKYVLVYHHSRGQQKIGVYTNLEKLVNDYIIVKKDFQVKEKLHKIDQDFQSCKHYFTLLCGLSIDKLRFIFYIISVEKREVTNEL